MSDRVFVSKPATRERVPVIVGLTGPSGAGKTFSALRLATGMQRVSGGEIFYVDSEARRALHYADRFKFQHIDFGAPFGSLDYLAAIQHCVAQNAATCIIDSMSHEHEGPGGLLETHEAELDRITRGDESKRDRMTMLAWQKPKAERRRLINSMVQLGCNLILCFRAGEKTKPIKGPDGKIKPVEMGFTPIAGPEFVYEMMMACMLLPGCKGVPTWDSQFPGERMATKLPLQFESIMHERQPLSEDIGEQLAQWASGAEEPEFIDGKQAAIGGVESLKAWWTALSPSLKQRFKSRMDSVLKPIATTADQHSVDATTPTE